jgi:peptide/nickel transport system substrate-binding protein
MTHQQIDRRRFLLAGASGGAAMLIAACGGSSLSSSSSAAGDVSSSSTTSGSAGTPVYGGTLTFYDPSDYISWDMLAGGNASIWSNSQVSPQLFDRLTWQDPASGKILPWIAKSWTISPDNLKYTFEIRPGVTFSDGTPLDAAAIKANYDLRGFGNAKNGVVQDQFWISYAKTVVHSPTSFTVFLSQPDAGWLQATSVYRAGSFVSLSTLKKNAADRGLIANAIGSGPFVYESGNGTNLIVLKRREDYNWAPPAFSHQGKAYLEKLVYQTVPEENVLIGGLASGEAQIVRGVQPYDEKTVTGQGGRLFSAGVQGQTNSLQWSLVPGSSQDVRVRQALLAATNRQEIHTSVLSPHWQVAEGILVHGTPHFVDGSKYLAYDPAKANSLLESAGWKLGSSGYREKSGQVLSFPGYIAPYYPVSQAVFELLQQQWKKVGVQLVLKNLSLTEYTAVVGKNAPFQQGQTSRADPDALYAAWDSKAGDGTFTVDPKLNQLTVNVARQTDPTKRQAAVTAVSDYLLGNAYEIPLYDETQVFGLSSKVHGYRIEATERSVLYDAWLSA